MAEQKKVAVIMGSDSDWPTVKAACTQLKELDIPFEAHILSAHRTPPLQQNLPKQPVQTALEPSSAPQVWLPIWRVLLPPTPRCL